MSIHDCPYLSDVGSLMAALARNVPHRAETDVRIGTGVSALKLGTRGIGTTKGTDQE